MAVKTASQPASLVRTLFPAEKPLARLFIKRLDEAQKLVTQFHGTCEPTPEWLIAREIHDEWDGTPDEYLRDQLQDREHMLRPDELQSYARFAAFTAEPASVERAVWAMLRSAEVDVIRLVEAMTSDLDQCVEDGASIVLDGRRFRVNYLDGDRSPLEARLTIEAAPLAKPSLN